MCVYLLVQEYRNDLSECTVLNVDLRLALFHFPFFSTRPSLVRLILCLFQCGSIIAIVLPASKNNPGSVTNPLQC